MSAKHVGLTTRRTFLMKMNNEAQGLPTMRRVNLGIIVMPPWSEFARQYSSHIERWLQERGVADAHIVDAVEEVLDGLARRLSKPFTFEEGKQFRCYVATSARNVAKKYRARSGRERSLSDLAGPRTEELENEVAEGYLAQIRAALDRIRLEAKFKGSTIDVFVLKELEGWPVPKIMSEFAMKETAVLQAARRVRDRLQRELNP